MELHPDLDRIDPQEQRRNSRVLFIIGLLLIAFGIWIFFHLRGVEQQGGVLRGPALMIFLYEIAGKWGVAAVSIGVGLLTIHMGWLVRNESHP